MDKQLLENLRQAYDGKAEWRDRGSIVDWKEKERAIFMDYLQKEKKQTLLEIGAGPGRDSLFFQQNGFAVTATDLSPEMVRLCREKGLEAEVIDFENLAFAEPFDAIYGLNCLLHVPKMDLPAILQRLQGLLKPNGLFFMGVYGGYEFEGVHELDEHEPKRLFSFYSNERIQEVVGEWFTAVYFNPVPVDAGDLRVFQSMIWRR